ncbi:uncharacterized protein LOC120257424, partial [Dioscorea cayenensis subsp. rotundata]|uniref:Uncharacterized protein LOC120257424 n=1 Tax=Dioscorea cayennensis subsp. rotundata TaxID=55577 RepID=A0AB40B0Y3_DIOCR
LNAGITVHILLDLSDVCAIVHYGIAGCANDSLSFGDVIVPKFTLRIPAMVFRGVSDLAGGEEAKWSSTSLNTLACENALKVTVEFIVAIGRIVRRPLQRLLPEKVLDEMIKLINDPLTIMNNQNKAFALIEAWGEFGLEPALLLSLRTVQGSVEKKSLLENWQDLTPSLGKKMT